METTMLLPLALTVLGIVLTGTAGAAERAAYKHVDEKGNVTYSQTPPADGRETKKIDISPANTGRGGYVPERRTPHPPSGDQPSREDIAREKSRRMEEARQKRLAELEAECNRQRGTDCKNPQTLRNMAADNVPRGGRR